MIKFTKSSSLLLSLILFSCSFPGTSSLNNTDTINSVTEDFEKVIDLDKNILIDININFDLSNFGIKSSQCTLKSKEIDVSVLSNDKLISQKVIPQQETIQFLSYAPKDAKNNIIFSIKEDNKPVKVNYYEVPTNKPNLSLNLDIDNKNNIALKDKQIFSSTIPSSSPKIEYGSLDLSVGVKESNRIVGKPIKEGNTTTGNQNTSTQPLPAFTSGNEVIFKQGTLPSISKDGYKVAYFDNFDLYLSDINGNNAKVLKSDVRFGKSSFSPDGRIAFIDEVNGSRGIFVINQDGSNLQRLNISGGIDTTSLSWSSDGKKMAYSAVKNGQSDIFTINIDGTGEKNITNDSYSDTSPAWSPDGKRITYVTSRQVTGTTAFNQDIMIVNSDGSTQFNLTGGSKEVDSSKDPYWSNDGNYIVFSANEKSTNKVSLYISNFDALYLTKLTNSGNERTPFWIPFEKKIGYVRSGSIYFSDISN